MEKHQWMLYFHQSAFVLDVKACFYSFCFCLLNKLWAPNRYHFQHHKNTNTDSHVSEFLHLIHLEFFREIWKEVVSVNFLPDYKSQITKVSRKLRDLTSQSMLYEWRYYFHVISHRTEEVVDSKTFSVSMPGQISYQYGSVNNEIRNALGTRWIPCRKI